MSSEKHTNLGLHKWAPTDGVLRTEFNDNFGKVDEKVAEVVTGIGEVTELGNAPRSLSKTISERGINVRDFGAIGDGNSHPLSGFFTTLADAKLKYPHATSLTDEIDWAAIQGAINYCGTTNRFEIHVPDGLYISNKTLTITKVIKIKGSLRKQSSLKYNGTGICVDIIGTPNNGFLNSVVFENMEVVSAGVRVGTGINCVYAKLDLYHCSVHQFDKGVVMDNSWLSKFEHTRFSSNRIGVHLLYACNNMAFGDCQFITNTEVGLLSEAVTSQNSWQNQVNGCDLEFNGVAIKLKHAWSWQINSNYFEANSINDIATVWDTTVYNQAVSIENNYFHGGNAQTTAIKCDGTKFFTFSRNFFINYAAAFDLNDVNTVDCSVERNVYTNVANVFLADGYRTKIESYETTGITSKAGMYFDRVVLSKAFASTEVIGRSIFEDSVDGKLKYKDGTGSVQQFGRFVAVPASATATGKPGDWSSDGSYLYTCHATNLWRRVSIATW